MPDQTLSPSLCVIKYGGNAMEAPELQAQISHKIAQLQANGIKPVVVHGGGPQINKALQAYGIETTFLNGLRVTPPEAFDVVKMVLCGGVNTHLVQLLEQAGAKAQGLNGTDQSFIQSEALSSELGRVGRITAIDPTPINSLIQNNIIPVIAPIAVNAERLGFNVNADTVAHSIAEVLHADYLIMLSNIPGVQDKEKQLIEEIQIDSIQHLIDDGTVQGGMIPKLEAARSAVVNGVGEVVIADGRQPERLLLNSLRQGNVGTRVVA